MRLIRVFVDAPLAPGARIALDRRAAEHVVRVLRLEAGAAITLFNGDGRDYPGRIRALGGRSVEVEIEGSIIARAESPLALTLVQGIARGERMDLVVQKATELGVEAIQPVVTARSVVKLDVDAGERKLAHWRGIAVAACEQSGRARIPAIAAPEPLTTWLARPVAADLRRLMLSPDAESPLATAAAGMHAVLLLVGPEGGLEPQEREAAVAAGYLACRLGPRILRSETAALAALAVLQSVAGDFA